MSLRQESVRPMQDYGVTRMYGRWRGVYVRLGSREARRRSDTLSQVSERKAYILGGMLIDKLSG